MSVTEVCRLCPNTTDLLNVFDKRLTNDDNMMDIVYITTGVQIRESDVISQKICSRCRSRTLKMYKFRQDAIKHDKELIERCRQILAEATIAVKSDISSSQGTSSDTNSLASISYANKKFLHSSVQELYAEYPNLKLPKGCLKLNISPVVDLNVGQIENFCKKRKLDMNALIAKSPKMQNNRIYQHYKDNFKARTENVEQLATSDVGLNAHNMINADLDQFSSNTHTDTLKINKGVNDRVDAGKNQYFMDSLGLTAKSCSSPISPETLSVTKKSTRLFVCNICMSVQSCPSDLKKHKLKHLMCQFCKRRFRSLEYKDAHLDGRCVFKNAQNNFPTVLLSKIEMDIETRKAYPNAFRDFDSLPNIIPKEESPDVVLLPIEPSDVIEINDSDEEDNNKSDKNRKDITNIIENEERLPGLTSTQSDSGVDVNSPSRSQNIPSSSIIKPDMEIKNSNILKHIDGKMTDIKIIKDLLCLLKPKHVSINEEVQTDLPSNQDVILNHSDTTCELKNLREQLKFYKIPLVIKKGSFDVVFNYEKTRKRKSNFHYWKDLPIIDIEKPPETEVNKKKDASPVNISKMLNNSLKPSNNILDNTQEVSNSLQSNTPTPNSSTDKAFKTPVITDICSGVAATNQSEVAVTNSMNEVQAQLLPDSVSPADVRNTTNIASFRVKNVWELQ